MYLLYLFESLIKKSVPCGLSMMENPDTRQEPLGIRHVGFQIDFFYILQQYLELGNQVSPENVD
jgi:hypothetical protein